MTAVNGPEGHKEARVDTCEAVVVGAGLVGATIATGLAAEGLQVAVLEARDVASGSTSRTAGFSGLPLPYAQLVEQQGHERAQALWQLTLDNRARMTAAADRLGVAVEHTGSLRLAVEAEEADSLQASAEMLEADGFEVRFEDADPLDRGFAAALRLPDDVVVDTVTLTERLLRGIPVRTGAEVYRLEQDGDEVLVLARGRTVRASTVVLAVNVYAPLLDDYFSDKVAPARGQFLITHPLNSRLVDMPGAAGPCAFRQTADGRLLFTVWHPGYQTPPAGPDDGGEEIDMMRFVGRHFPEAVDHLAQHSSGLMGTSRDELPLIGALPRLPQVFFAVGFGGYGLGLAFTAADLLVGLITRGAEPPVLSARRLE